MHHLERQLVAIRETDLSVRENPKVLIIQAKKKSTRSTPARPKQSKACAKPTTRPIEEAGRAGEEATEVEEDDLRMIQQPFTVSCTAKEQATGLNIAHKSWP